MVNFVMCVCRFKLKCMSACMLSVWGLPGNLSCSVCVPFQGAAMQEWQFCWLLFFSSFSLSHPLSGSLHTLNGNICPAPYRPERATTAGFSWPVSPRKSTIRHNNTAPFHWGMPASSWPCWHLALEYVLSLLFCILSLSSSSPQPERVSELQKLTCLGLGVFLWEKAGA